jgi:stearoyl-CoA desaturase (delta-9 desaturase)
VRQFVPDLIRDPWIAGVDRMYLLWVAVSILLPGAIGYAISGTSAAAWHGVVWAGLTRIFAVQQVTWAVNSVCHAFGQHRFDTGDSSRNHPIMAVLALGEGWHNNHHAFPGAAIHGLRSGELDLSGLVIRLLERFRVIWNVRRGRLPEPVEALSVGTPGG